MIEIYADGACSPNPGEMGVGIVFIYKGKKRELSKKLGHGTNQIAEISAIKIGLETLKSKTIPVRIYSDSQYAINLLFGKWNPKKNVDLINETKELIGTFSDVKGKWIRGHSGNKDNERADFLSKKDLPEWRYL